MDVVFKVIKLLIDMILPDSTAATLGISGLYTDVNSILTTGIVPNVVEILIPFGIGLGIIYVMNEYIIKLTLSNIDLEQLIKMFMKIIIIVAVVTNVMVIFTSFNDLVNGLANDIIKAPINYEIPTFGNVTDEIFSSLFGAKKDFLNNSSNESMMSSVVKLVPLSTSVSFSLLYSLIFAFVSFSRTIAIAYSVIYAPIALAGISTDNGTAKAINYLKRVFALFMQYPVIALILKASGLLFANTVFSDGILGFMILYFLTGIMMARSRNLSLGLFT